VKENGVYLVEDMHTSYWLKYNGGHKRKGTFVEYSKDFIDHLNAYHSEQSSLPITEFTKSVDSIHYYDSILVLEKRQKEAPFAEMSGNLKIDNYAKHGPVVRSAPSSKTSRQKLQNRVNKILRALNFKNIKI